MVNLRGLIKEVYVDLKEFGGKIYNEINPKLKIDYKKKMFYIKKENFLANSIGTFLIILGYNPNLFNSEI